MELRELRIGNFFIGYDGKIGTVDIDFYSILVNSELVIDEIIKESVILTDEWLLKFGFEKTRTDEFGVFWFNFVDFSVTKDENGTWKFYYNTFYIKNTPKHVHQLQNLYYALTGSELVLSTVPVSSLS